MSQVIQYRCDVCQQLSGTTTGWLRVYQGSLGGFTITTPITAAKVKELRTDPEINSMTVELWNQLDVCGSQCLCKAISNGQGR